MKTRAVVPAVLALIVTLPRAVVAEYEAVDVKNPGAIHGRVRVAGKVPERAVVAVQKDATVCGAHVEDRSLLVGENGALRNAVVYLGDVALGKPIDVDAVSPLDNRHCHFEPHVQTLTVGQTLSITNSDPILHNTHSYVLEGGKGNRFNLALARQGTTIRKRLREAGLHQVKCDAGHTWMSAFFWVFEHPYHVVTGEDGRFQLDSLPAGDYTLHVWHETLGRQVQQVHVEAGKPLTLPDLVFDIGKPVD